MVKDKRSKERRSGFTLLELMMVVIIIAILASIALPQYIRATEKARASEVLNLLGAIRSAQLRYRAQDVNGAYANATAGLDITVGTPAAWAGPNYTVNGGTGVSQFTRSGGQFNGQTVGLTYGTGTLCGTFAPLQITANVCIAD